jgi:hypothetical protein
MCIFAIMSLPFAKRVQIAPVLRAVNAELAAAGRIHKLPQTGAE